jgi:arginine-tRNA-protein transferase
MTLLNDVPLRNLQFYITSPYPCSYLADHEARSQVATPAYLIDTAVYSELVQAGFRRSGLYTYRPYCDRCRACVPVRLDVAEFKPTRAQRRAQKQHQNLEAAFHELKFDDEHYALYRRYQAGRHKGGGMDQDSREQFDHFLLQSNVATNLVEFREGDKLRMVSVIDRLADGLSSVYTFYDPDLAHASFGTYNVLWQVQLCRSLGLPYLYLGYWIAQSPKMAYKSNFRPLQMLADGRWQAFAEQP